MALHGEGEVSGAQRVFLKRKPGAKKVFAKGNTAGTPKKKKGDKKGKPFAEGSPLEQHMAARAVPGSEVFGGSHNQRSHGPGSSGGTGGLVAGIGAKSRSGSQNVGAAGSAALLKKAFGGKRKKKASAAARASALKDAQRAAAATSAKFAKRG